MKKFDLLLNKNASAGGYDVMLHKNASAGGYDVLLNGDAPVSSFDVILHKNDYAGGYDVLLRDGRFIGSISVDGLPLHYSSGAIESELAVNLTIDPDGYFFGKPFGEQIEGRIGVGLSVADVLKTINAEVETGISIGANVTPSKQTYTPFAQGIMTGMGISGLFKNLAFEGGLNSALTVSFAVNEDELLMGKPLGEFANGLAVGMSVSGDAIKDSYYFIKPDFDTTLDMSVDGTQLTTYDSASAPIAIGITGNSILQRYRKVSEMTELMSAYADMPMSELIYITITE